MFTNNYKKFKALQFGITGKGNEYERYETFTDWENTNREGRMVAMSWLDIGYCMKCARCGSLANVVDLKYPRNYGVYFGGGSTPATENDYKLESLISSGLSITNPSNILTVPEKDGRYSLVANYIVQNTTGAAINIYEIGLYSYLGDSYIIGQYMNWYPLLYERTVLSEPITIPAGRTKIITYKITFNQTLNVE